jgi:tetratricopeptide (TPR) repeat protein
LTAVPAQLTEDGFTTRQVAGVLNVSDAEVRAFTRVGFVEPRRGARNENIYTFRDVVLLRTTKELRDAGVAPRKIRSSLLALQERLPGGVPLTQMTISTSGDHVVVHDALGIWEPDSGQLRLDFGAPAPSETSFEGVPHLRLVPESAGPVADGNAADDWYNLGIDLEDEAPERARAAYRQTLDLCPDHADARANLGRLLHQEGDLAGAEREYRAALEAEPNNATAAFNLGVALEDQGRSAEALEAYARAIHADADFAAAHFNLSRMHEAAGRPDAALRHLAEYRRLNG